MAIAAIHPPLVSTRPPFVTLSIVWAVLGLSCVFQTDAWRIAIRRVFSVGTFFCLLCTAFGVYQVEIGYRTGSLALLVIGTVTIALCGTGTAVVIIRGSWSERHARRR